MSGVTEGTANTTRRLQSDQITPGSMRRNSVGDHVVSIVPCRPIVTIAALQHSGTKAKFGKKRMLAGVCLLWLSAGSVFAEPRTCHRAICPSLVPIASVAEHKVYGLLISAPKAGCRLVRYRIETEGLELLGRTPALAAGEVAVVRVGNGFQPGSHTMVVTAEGCTKSPGFFRQVTLRKASPDHGWRAAMAAAALANLARITARSGLPLSISDNAPGPDP
jgi:hypothetical protein